MSVTLYSTHILRVSRYTALTSSECDAIPHSHPQSVTLYSTHILSNLAIIIEDGHVVETLTLGHALVM